MPPIPRHHRPLLRTDSPELRRIAVLRDLPRELDPGTAGAVAALRGSLAEDRVLQMLLNPPTPLGWLLGARLATPEEDARGIDVVVVCDDMPHLYLQVKASRQAAKVWRNEMNRRRRKPPVIVCAPHHVEDEVIWGRILAALILAREAREQERAHHGR